MFSRPLLVLAIFLLAIVLFVFLRFTPSDYLSLFFHFVLFILLIVLSAIDLHLLITYHFFSFCPFYFTHCIVRHRFTPSDYHCSTFELFLLLNVLCVLRSTASDYPFGTFDLFCPSSFTHCIVRPSIYGFWLTVWYF